MPIFDQGYQHWTGPLSGHAWRWLAVARHGVRATLKNRVVRERVTKLPDQAESVHIFNYPYPAIEEALVNAIYHRGYNQREPIEVRVNPGSIEVLSYPGPDSSVRLDALKRERILSRRYRNRRIGEFLKELELTEGRFTGIPKIREAMRRNGSPPPNFETDEERTFFAVELLINPAFLEAHDEAHDGFAEPGRRGLVNTAKHARRVLAVIVRIKGWWRPYRERAKCLQLKKDRR